MPGLQPFSYGNVLAQAEGIRGAGLKNQLMQQQLSQNALTGGDRIEFGKVNPRDFTPESMEIFRQSQNFNDLNRYERFRTGNINGALHLIDVQGEQPPIPLSTTQSEAEARRQLAAAGERGKLETQIKYQPQKDIQEIEQLQKIGAVDLELKPQIEKAEARQAKLGAHEAQLEINRPKAGMQVLSTRQKTARLKANIARARSQANVWTVGYMGEKLMDVAGTPAHDLKQTLSTLQANAGFDRLQEMRDNSVTGGALGQVSERELKLLVDAYEALAQTQSKEQFLEKLDLFEDQLDKSWRNVELAYEITYGEKYTEAAWDGNPDSKRNIVGQPEQSGWTIEEVK